MKTKCQFISIENIWNGDIQITIPDIQRGLVWNAAQIEVFWDSLLRGIPIGLFSVTESAGELILLDGQQRWHAVNAAKPTRTVSCGVRYWTILPNSTFSIGNTCSAGQRQPIHGDSDGKKMKEELKG